MYPDRIRRKKDSRIPGFKDSSVTNEENIFFTRLLDSLTP
jgi:hypothetical protein